MVWAAETIACRPLPHKRLSVKAGVSTGRPPLMAATRARYMSWTSVWMTLPKTTCPTSSGWMPARVTAAGTTWAPSSVGGLPLKPPPKSPMAVRTPLRTTTSGCAMFFSLLLLLLILMYYSTNLTTTISLLSYIHPDSHSIAVYDEAVNGCNCEWLPLTCSHSSLFCSHRASVEDWHRISITIVANYHHKTIPIWHTTRSHLCD